MKPLVFLLLISLSFSAYRKYKQNEFIFFDPKTENACGEMNYWTPFNTKTSCYRFVNMETDDTTEKSTLRIMLDHNEAMATFADISSSIATIQSSWVRAKNYKISIVPESEISKLIGFSSKPTSSKKEVSPSYKPGHYFMNSFYVLNGTTHDQYAYWTSTSYDTSLAYAISNTCLNKLYEKTKKLGIRPVLTIAKSLLTPEAGVINIDSLLTKKYPFAYENKEYGGKIYKQLQGFTLTKDKLVFHASNSGNPDYGVLYSYLTKDFKTTYKKEYAKTGHGNDLTYNSKKNTVLLVGPNSYHSIFEYNGTTIKKIKEYPDSSAASMSSIGYDEQSNMYVGKSGVRMILADTKEIKRKYCFDFAMFETAQGGEAHDGYWFYVTSDLGVGDHQTKSFYGAGKNVIHVYNIKFDKTTKKPTTDFGRLVCRLIVSGKGELETVSFQGNYIYLGFATQKIDKTYTYTFWQINYDTFKTFIQTEAKKKGGNYIK